MAKYNYDKSVLKGLGVGAFLNEVKVRQEHIEKAEEKPFKSVYNPNILAAKLHPAFQYAVVKEVIDRGDAKTFVLEPNQKKGCTEFAYFRAGQYAAIELEIDGTYCWKPYTIACGPKDALGEKKNTYSFTIKSVKGSKTTEYILNKWRKGTPVKLTGPLGEFYYERLRDAKHVVAVAGGSGITPFLSMAQAIADKTEDFKLTIFYGSRTASGILLKDELDKYAEASNGKVRVVNVLSDEEKEGYEHGFITAELIRRYVPKVEFSAFVCGPKPMYKFIAGEFAKLDLPRRRIRYEVSGEYGNPVNDEAYPKDAAGKTFNVKVWIHGEEQTVVCKSEQSLLQAMEGAGIKVPSNCRSGECGWCHSRLIAGDVYIPSSNDGRRAGDKKFGWIHPCSTYPLSDVELEVFPIV